MRRQSCSGCLIPAAVMWAILMSGCMMPDHRPVFTPDFDVHIAEDDAEPVAVPDVLQPRPDALSPAEFPKDGPLDLSVEQAVMLSLANNRDLRVRRLGPVIAGTFEQIERGNFDPEIFGEFEYAEEEASETARSTGTQFSVKGHDAFAAGGVRQQLPSGTRVEASVSHERSISNRAPEQQIARLGVSVTQSLLRGFGPAVNLVSVRQAELDTAASVYELRGFTEALAADTEIAYWNMALARKEIAIYEQSLAVARQQRDEVEQRIEVGVLPEIEAPAARAEVARREQALIDARSQLEERRLRLLRLLDPDPEGLLDRAVNTASEPSVSTVPITDLADRLRLAEQLRADLNEARLRLTQNRLETIVTRNGLLPLLDLFVVLGKTGFADTFPDAFRELDGDTYDAAVGIRLSRYVGNRAAKARDLAARASRRQSAEAVENLRQLVRLDVRLAANEVERARKQISASRITRELEEQTLRAEKEMYDVGTSTALLVAQAQRDLLLSQIAEVRAVINYRIALVRLHLAEGSLLERRGVKMAGDLRRDPHQAWMP
ncbi:MULTISPECIES: TolC family protein [Desulfococcus]|uniref:Outer membrane efflux protein n=1 Tax=Desulfococcus multivorans DSM 2059 TaxID=1121405 RepID=S7UPE2_DESML|nr:TolC family protein [Desulfococcus multivorans]AQV02029.1 transporter [Desulfococcus multivorans]EPR35869.1 outer membrane efflux protein [Desulfococcus multivorans DSM 2059]SJZ34415.1 Outer membrane protein TolC [Desulfococcus multivorans DSM 2059]